MESDLIKIRYPAVAGTFYPSDKENLKSMIDEYLADAENRVEKFAKTKNQLKALIVPHAGYIYSGPIAATGYKLLEKFYGAASKNLKILLLGLSHHMLFMGAAVSTDKIWETPLGNIKAKNLREEIEDKNNLLKELESAHEPEHSLEVQLPFLQTVLKNFTLYPLALSEIDPEKLADTLLPFCKDENVLIIVSSDLSHYLPYREAQEKDKISNELILELDMEKAEFNLDACNKTGILTLMHIVRRLNLKPHLLDYRNSGDTAGDKSAVVGYSSIGFFK